MAALRLVFVLCAILGLLFAWTYDGPSNQVHGASARSAHEANLIRSRMIQAMLDVDPNGPTQWIRKWQAINN
ncbi:unnamed protein product, partial [Mesorhabditis spiculigera]